MGGAGSAVVVVVVVVVSTLQSTADGQLQTFYVRIKFILSDFNKNMYIGQYDSFPPLQSFLVHLSNLKVTLDVPKV